MKKSIYLSIFGAIVILGSCKPEPVNISKVITGLTLSNRTIVADGTSIIYLSVQLNNQADADKQNVIFTASGGTFPAGKDTTITQAASFVNGQLIATVAWQAPLQPGTIRFKAMPAAPSPYADFILSDSIKLASSVPSTLTLVPSAAWIKQSGGSELMLTATLKNAINNNVSTGYTVSFSDYYPGGASVGGTYRAVRDTTDATSTAVAYYSIGMQAGSFYIKCSLNSQPAIQDSVLITVSQ